MRKIIYILFVFLFINISNFANEIIYKDTIKQAKPTKKEQFEKSNLEKNKKLNDHEEFDEFEEFENLDEKSSQNDDEFENLGSEESKKLNCNKQCKNMDEGISDYLLWILWILFFTVMAGVFVRFEILRNTRAIFLIAGIILMGFYRGACPCPISSIQNLFLWIIGENINWQTTVWFLSLLPITYFLGKVWCGWICHLGALQEFLFLPTKVKILQSEKSQKIMRIIRIILFVILIIQLLMTRTILFDKIDPFKVAFNLFATNTTAWILFFLMIISSLFIYRPFCKTVCPIGLVLGWIAKIPFASVIGQNGDCRACSICNNACKIRAITRDDKFSKLDNQECMACGECLTDCKKNAISFYKKTKIHSDKIDLKKLN